ncbi:MAG: hypothetical protein R6U61_04440 [Thermoplasmata archaeon]
MEKDKKDEDGILQHFYVSGVEPFKYGKLDVDREIAKENMDRYNYERLTHYYDSIFTYIVIFLFALFALFIIWVPYSGAVRWLIIILALGIIASLILRKISKESKPIIGWKKTSKLKQTQSSDFTKTSNLVQRAFKGLEISQTLLEQRLKNNFIEMMKHERGYSPDYIEELLEDHGKLREVVGDDIITEFLINCNNYRELCRGSKSPSSKVSYKEDKDYRKKIKDLINRMEDWS